MTSTRLTQQTRSREWAPQTLSPAPGNSWHGSDAGSNTTHSTSTQYNHRTAFLPVLLPQGRPCTRPTHAHGWAGGCCVVGAPTRSPLGPARGGGETARILPRAIERDQFAAPKASRRPPSPTKPCLPIPSSPANLSQAGRGRHESGRALLLLLSPLDLIPPRLAPSWPLRWA